MSLGEGASYATDEASCSSASRKTCACSLSVSRVCHESPRWAARNAPPAHLKQSLPNAHALMLLLHVKVQDADRLPGVVLEVDRAQEELFTARLQQPQNLDPAAQLTPLPSAEDTNEGWITIGCVACMRQPFIPVTVLLSA